MERDLYSDFLITVTQLNSNFEWKKFADALKSGDNKTIESNKFIRALDTMIDEKSGFIYEYEKDRRFYRARIVDDFPNVFQKGVSAFFDENNQFHSTGYDVYNSKERPVKSYDPEAKEENGIPGAGRANILGMSYLYLAEEEYTACAEIKPNGGDLISVATFQLKKDIRVIDFNVNQYVGKPDEIRIKEFIDPAILITRAMESFAISRNKQPDIYAVTQFISDYIRKAGFDGIRFRSSMCGGTNLTLFNSHHSVIEYQDSKLVYAAYVQPLITDLNSGKQIKPIYSEPLDDEGLRTIREQLVKEYRLFQGKEPQT